MRMNPLQSPLLRITRWSGLRACAFTMQGAMVRQDGVPCIQERAWR